MSIRTFMSGVIALLPIAATVAIVAWAGSLIYSYFGPGSAIGRLLTSLGLGLVGSPLVAYLVGLVIVACLVYGLGVMVESSLEPRLYGRLDAMMQRIPLIGNVYDLSKRFVGMLDRKEAKDVRGMSPVWCFFGGHGSAAVLALLPKPEQIMIAGEPYHVVLVPFAPIPFGGTLIYVPAKWVVPAEMRVEGLMSAYVSMGVASPREVRGIVAPTPSLPPQQA
jgi:uncharacterized membrane protein